jgi:hypothetical protein
MKKDMFQAISKWGILALALFAGISTIPKDSWGLAPNFCDYKIQELQIYYGDGSKASLGTKAKISMFKTKASSIRDSIKLNTISNEKWFSNGSWAKIEKYKFAIISIPDTRDCKEGKTDTTYFDSNCSLYEQGETIQEIAPQFLLIISRLVSEKDYKEMFASKACKAKLKYAINEKEHPQAKN